MATIRKRGTRYQVQVRKSGTNAITKTFTSLRSAKEWAKKTESTIEQGDGHQFDRKDSRVTFGDVIEKYIEHKKLNDHDPSGRLSNLKSLREVFGKQRFATLRQEDVVAYRDKRLLTHAPASVRKDLAWLSAVINHATSEFGYVLPQGNPVQKIKLPTAPSGRTRRLGEGEEAKLRAHADPQLNDIITIALETAARRHEIVELSLAHINRDARTWHIPKTKNGSARTVPLSTRALQSIPASGPSLPFHMHPSTLSRQFQTLCQSAEVEGLVFHDLRHEATSRLFEMGLNHMEVATITGHKDLKMLMRYTHLRAEDLVEKLK